VIPLVGGHIFLGVSRYSVTRWWGERIILPVWTSTPAEATAVGVVEHLLDSQSSLQGHVALGSEFGPLKDRNGFN